MTTEREYDPDATVKIPRPVPIEPELEDVDPEKTLVREDWESKVIRRVAPRIAEVQSEVARGSNTDQSSNAEEGFAKERFGWEAEGLRRLSRVVSSRSDE